MPIKSILNKTSFILFYFKKQNKRSFIHYFIFLAF